MARPSYLGRREGGRYFMQIRLGKPAASLYGSPILRASLGTADFTEARRRLMDSLVWAHDLVVAPDLETVGSILHARLKSYVGRPPSASERALAERCAFEHQVRHYMGRANERGYSFCKTFPGFASIWVDFVDQNKSVEQTVHRIDRHRAYEEGRNDPCPSRRCAGRQASPPVSRSIPALAYIGDRSAPAHSRTCGREPAGPCDVGCCRTLATGSGGAARCSPGRRTADRPHNVGSARSVPCTSRQEENPPLERQVGDSCYRTVRHRPFGRPSPSLGQQRRLGQARPRSAGHPPLAGPAGRRLLISVCALLLRPEARLGRDFACDGDHDQGAIPVRVVQVHRLGHRSKALSGTPVPPSSASTLRIWRRCLATPSKTRNCSTC
jgi:hypothetical protein